jgi:hypothetical protein
VPDPQQPTLFEPVQFSQANKLCFRATPEQSAWLASHMATTGKAISAVLRNAIDIYIAANQPTGPS